MSLISEPIAVAGLVTREVRTGSRDGAPTRIVVARRTYPTDQADLWDALTDPDRIRRWFVPVTGDLTVGGRYQVEGNASGVVQECAPPQRFAATWEMGPQMSWLEVSLSPAGQSTTLTLTHEAHVDPEMWSQFGPGAVGVGWDLGLLGLGLYVSSGAAVDPAEAAALPGTPEGVAFIRAVASGGADAAVGDGDDPAGARTAAEQTVGFYTAVPEDVQGS
jgi:uncharacterized protein YndB with AHSA1/START domain